MLHPPNSQDWIFTESVLPTETDDDPSGHGTCVASKAVGRTNGVAKASRLVPVKMQYREDDLLEAFIKIISDVVDRRREGKAVIVCSLGTIRRYRPNIIRDQLPPLWQEILGVMDYISDRLNGVLVLSAGNHGWRSSSSDTLPAAVRSNHFLIVGSTTQRGIKTLTSQSSSNTFNRIWAVGDRVACASHNNPEGIVQQSGTSFAAPAVSIRSFRKNLNVSVVDPCARSLVLWLIFSHYQ